MNEMRTVAKYAVAITPEMAALIDDSDPCDPIALQFVPSSDELVVTPEERADPIGDAAHSPVPGIVHRHRDRVLFKPVLSCPVYCRFCFRREEVGQGKSALSPEAVARALDYIAAHREIREVIFTGGDPFVLSPRRIAELSAALADIPHVKLLRWHTRVPVVEPSRVSDELVAALLVPGATTFVALHANHPREFSPAARAAIARLVDAGIPLLSQSVLLKGVNAEIATLEALMRAFVENRIKPYYLHHPDLAPGTGHFRVSIEEGQALMRELRARVSGLCVPDYVLDIPGGFAKVSLLSENVVRLEGGRYRIRDHAGRWHTYPPTDTAR
ncbi:MAG: lysine-2,3-aminomutase-like protein [Alphaproteobacteria bacterium]|nr:lysine-2,3-aminomutase-like protein [Alphaproteobacteria bacterium]